MGDDMGDGDMGDDMGDGDMGDGMGDGDMGDGDMGDGELADTGSNTPLKVIIALAVILGGLMLFGLSRRLRSL